MRGTGQKVMTLCEAVILALKKHPLLLHWRRLIADILRVCGVRRVLLRVPGCS